MLYEKYTLVDVQNLFKTTCSFGIIKFQIQKNTVEHSLLCVDVAKILQ